MNYVTSYWIPPDAPDHRKDSLQTYFDLQRYTKQQFGADQIIVTNLDYPGALPFIEPPGFKREYGMFAKLFGIGQLIDQGLEFPIVVHDHDMFVREGLPHSETAILCASMEGHRYSDQLAVYPEVSRNALTGFIDHLKTFEFVKKFHHGYGSEARHEKMYSTEMTLGNTKPNPFADIPIEIAISFRDLVSFDILEHHSLDSSHCECDLIPPEVQAVHGHLNKGPATEALVDWLVG